MLPHETRTSLPFVGSPTDCKYKGPCYPPRGLEGNAALCYRQDLVRADHRRARSVKNRRNPRRVWASKWGGVRGEPPGLAAAARPSLRVHSGIRNRITV